MKKRIVSLLMAATALGAMFAACAKDEPALPEFCTVTFVMPDGTEQKVRVEKGGSLYSDQIPVLEVEGYTGVAKWDRTQFDNIQSDITVNVDKTNLTPNEYTVTYSIGDDVSLPDGVNTTFKVKYDSEYVLDIPILPEDNYFWYWYSGAGDNKKVFGMTGTWKTAGDVTLFARYEERPEGKVAVRFEKNDGSEPIIVWVDKGQSFEGNLPDLPTTPGYNFVWNKTKPELTNLNEDVTVTLVRTSKEYYITLDLALQGATVSSTIIEVNYNEIPVLPIPVPPSSNYEFEGWKIKNSGEKFNANKPYTYTDNITLVAQWGSYTDFY